MASRLRRARELDGRFKEATEAARSLGITVSTYLGHENGSRGFVRRAGRYAAFYKVNPTWLITGVGNPKLKGLDAQFIDLPPEMLEELVRYAEFLRQRQQK